LGGFFFCSSIVFLKKKGGGMLVIRRAVDKYRSYTVIFLKGEQPKWIPTSDYEHNRILEIYKQDRFYEGIINDFSDIDWGRW
jgi:hypothetical protein